MPVCVARRSAIQMRLTFALAKSKKKYGKTDKNEDKKKRRTNAAM